MSDTPPILLLTRPAAGAQAFWEALPGATQGRVTCISSPLIAAKTMGSLPDLATYDGVILTSTQAVASLREHLGGRSVRGTLAYCVGDATADAAASLGMVALSADGDAEALFAMITTKTRSGRLLHLRGVHSRGNLAARLSEAGHPTEERVIYEQVAQPLSGPAQAALEGTTPVIAPLFSPRTAQLFAEYSPTTAPLYLPCMSAAVLEQTETLKNARQHIANAPTSAEMVSLTVALVDAACFLISQRGRL